MKHESLYNSDGTPKEGVDIVKLRKLSDALHNPNVLPDWPFSMKGYFGTQFKCAIGIANELRITTHKFAYDLVPDERSDAWQWCFGGQWLNVDDTREGAALRIDYALDTGIPENWLEQRMGQAPLCYRQ